MPVFQKQQTVSKHDQNGNRCPIHFQAFNHFSMQQQKNRTLQAATRAIEMSDGMERTLEQSCLRIKQKTQQQYRKSCSDDCSVSKNTHLVMVIMSRSPKSCSAKKENSNKV